MRYTYSFLFVFFFFLILVVDAKPKFRPNLRKVNIPEFEPQTPVEVEEPPFHHEEQLDHVEEGTEVLVEGRIDGRFDIDLKCAGGSKCIPLHICVRPSEQVTVNDYWTKLYEHRMDYESIRSVRVKGKINMDLLDVFQPELELATDEEAKKKFKKI
ncbi:hypothetical protein CAEBREN_06148 [Caenorhabditis brenneri]|uniref:Galectin domain-containing protein n=1 Tax=Caenorhabditis brenneri TaxID=135651 RepID=G0P7V8_CAEBE|nr:hypothetical protein CAEBREN_06148 [Caenorhabditis brenneri]